MKWANIEGPMRQLYDPAAPATILDNLTFEQVDLFLTCVEENNPDTELGVLPSFHYPGKLKIYKPEGQAYLNLSATWKAYLAKTNQGD